MTSILCLAHFCEVHGPTPIMVTEGLSVPCTACYDLDHEHGLPDDASHSTAAISSSTHAATTAAVTEAMQKVSLLRAQEAAAGDVPQGTSSSSRRLSSQQQAPPPQQRDSGHFRKTYDDYVRRRANPCDNCAMTLPRRKEGKDSNSPGADARNPTLRTRVPCARVYGTPAGDASPYASQPVSSSASSTSSSSSASSDTDGEDKKPRAYAPRRPRTGTLTSTSTSRSRSSNSSTSPRLNGHTHYIDYTSTHEPLVASSYSIIRASCLRTLSLEMLPRNPSSAGSGSTSPLILPQTPSFVTAHSSGAGAGAAAAGGPLFFGDPVAGYTTAHVFRVSDVHARGHKRIYALIALTTHRERLAMKTFGYLSGAFHDLADWIQQLAEAEAEAERALSESSSASSPVGPSANYAFSSIPSQPPPPQQQQQQQSSDDDAGGSSFLAAAGSGLTRRMGGGFGGFGGYGGPSASIRARGLPEILGMPDFFIELHSRFVRLLLELGVTLNA